MKTIRSSLVGRWNGTLTWSRNSEKIARIGYQVIRDENEPSAVRLYYTWNDTDMSYLVRLNSTPLPWGGSRYWFTCPNTRCNRRVENLYMPPGNPYFACRTCHQLTYRSCQEKGQSDAFLQSMAAAMQDLYPGMTAKDLETLLDGKYTDRMHQILLVRYLGYLVDLPDPYGEYLTIDELCEKSGLSIGDIRQLETARLLLPDHDGKYRPKLVGWAGKLAYLLNQNWQVDEIKRWARGRFKTGNPKQWPPQRSD
jgi:hypothetical protein